MSSERIRFTVTQEHIDAATHDMPVSMTCPVALALAAHDGHEWMVSSVSALRDGGDDFTCSYRVAAAVRAFDGNRSVTPFTGEVYR